MSPVQNDQVHAPLVGPFWEIEYYITNDPEGLTYAGLDKIGMHSYDTRLWVTMSFLMENPNP